MGGDLTGKGLVPVIAGDGSYRARVLGEERRARTPEELTQLDQAIRMNGMYACHVSEQEFQDLRSDLSLVEAKFEEMMLKELERWVELADARLTGSGVMAYVMPGNDDPWSIDEVLERSENIVVCDERIVRIGEREMLSFGWSNRTPWNTPRELDEDELYRRLRTLADSLESPSSSIMNIHVPPLGTGLDTACEVDETLRYVMRGGQPHEVPTGSVAVRQIIEEVQPVLTLHGHIHESKGMVRMGRTWAINPGSEYATGRLDGCLVELDGERVRHRHLVRG
jgi:Icc-related predicted phosphoesterase